MGTVEGVPRLVVAAAGTGQGKTTVAAAIMALLAERGFRVAPFKAGPDYIDPAHHHAAAGRPGRSLDAWLLPPDTLLALFRRAITGRNAADVAVVEGMMGLFDGRGATDEGSTAHVARLLRAPVIAVIDVWTMGRTAAAVAYGLHTLAPDLPLAGVILNRCAGEGHFALCRDAVLQAGVPVLGWLPADDAIRLPERHLGLTTAAERPLDVARLRELARATLDTDAIVRVARSAGALPAFADPLPARVTGTRARIAVARDRAFNFYYPENLDLLRDAGAELVPFSPLADAAVPDADGLYLGGGYPELHAAALAANGSMLESVRAFAASGRPVVAECGGLMYLAEWLVDGDGARHAMAGVIPGTSALGGLTLGYREAEALADSPVAERGWTVRGHEFHHSTRDAPPDHPAYRLDTGAAEGFVSAVGNVIATYLHLHWGADPRMASRFVHRAAAHRR
ncbi:MAG TPA: cobyrinate a,c-diamide synthase [Longimicrobium sp.]|jgi:cobyrinic acid a,c-diamide synthase|uniref:cobyrinate a,c-diamide synthase n=1 Tax=Longimicrobium sp. TaxID=2029185 RepID=UPI002ED9EA19